MFILLWNPAPSVPARRAASRQGPAELLFVLSAFFLIFVLTLNYSNSISYIIMSSVVIC